MLLPAIRLILSCLLLLKSVIYVFNEPILLERLSNEVLRFVILSFVILLLGIVIVDVFKFDTIILVDKLIVSLTLLITKLLSGLLYWPPDAKASIVQEEFRLDIEMLLPATRLILSCL